MGKSKKAAIDDSALFSIDRTGDETVRRQIAATNYDTPIAHARKRGGKPLKSSLIIAGESDVQPVHFRAHPGLMTAHKRELQKRQRVSEQVKRRLRSMVKHQDRAGRGLALTDKSKEGMDVSAAVKAAGSADLWDAPEIEMESDIAHIVNKPAPKAPTSLHKHALLSELSIPAIRPPAQGQSYNPTLEAHQALLRAELALAEKAEAADDKVEEIRNRLLEAGRQMAEHPTENGYKEEVGSGESGDEEETTEAVPKKKQPRRKTTKEKQKRRENKIKEAQSQESRKTTLAQKRAISQLAKIAEALEAGNQPTKGQLALLASLPSNGLATVPSGPSKVPLPKNHFLLSEELPETLRQLKPDGNLWNEWLDSSRRRGKVQTERKTYGMQTKKKGRSTKLVERYSFKRFE